MNIDNSIEERRSVQAMNKLTFTVKITVDGDPDEMFKLVSQYLTLTDYPFLVDYGPDAWGGYEGPRIRNISVHKVASEKR